MPDMYKSQPNHKTGSSGLPVPVPNGFTPHSDAPWCITPDGVMVVFHQKGNQSDRALAEEFAERYSSMTGRVYVVCPRSTENREVVELGNRMDEAIERIASVYDFRLGPLVTSSTHPVPDAVQADLSSCRSETGDKPSDESSEMMKFFKGNT